MAFLLLHNYTDFITKSIGKNWMRSSLMRKSTAPSVVSVAKRTSVRRVTLNGRKPAQIGGTVSVRKG